LSHRQEFAFADQLVEAALESSLFNGETGRGQQFSHRDAVRVAFDDAHQLEEFLAGDGKWHDFPEEVARFPKSRQSKIP
jgi:hypothetical protein